jgi:predicted transcriptional regulator
MKDIILSIKYKYAKAIIEGQKQYEFRGWIWKDNVRYIYLYSSENIHKIIARFKIKQIINDKPNQIWIKCKGKSGLKEEDYFSYVEMFNYDTIYAIEISELKVLEPNNYISLDKLNIKNAPQRFKYLDERISRILEDFFNE